MAAQRNERPVYTAAEVKEYLERISFPVDKFPQISPHAARTSINGYHYLCALMYNHLIKVPIENLDLHYATSPTISLHSQILFNKIVRSKRGGSVNELNMFFANVLKSLGYEVLMTGARSSRPDQVTVKFFIPINLIRIDDIWYLVDVAYGMGGPTSPLPLNQDVVILQTLTTPSIYQIHLQYSQRNPPVVGFWILQQRVFGDWVPQYCFNLAEFNAMDFERINFAMAQYEAAYPLIACFKMMPNKDSTEIIGSYEISGASLTTTDEDGLPLKRQEFQNEYQRQQSIRTDFEISLPDADLQKIETKNIRLFKPGPRQLIGGSLRGQMGLPVISFPSFGTPFILSPVWVSQQKNYDPECNPVGVKKQASGTLVEKKKRSRPGIFGLRGDHSGIDSQNTSGVNSQNAAGNFWHQTGLSFASWMKKRNRACHEGGEDVPVMHSSGEFNSTEQPTVDGKDEDSKTNIGEDQRRKPRGFSISAMSMR